MADEQKIDASKTDHAAHLASVVDEITSHSESASLFDWNLDENGAISKVFNYAFKFGGLDEVDGLIEDLNSLLLARGAQYILKPGAACQLNSDGEPEALMVYYQKSGGSNPICNQWIVLEQDHNAFGGKASGTGS